MRMSIRTASLALTAFTLLATGLPAACRTRAYNNETNVAVGVPRPTS